MALTAAQINIVKSTAPILKVHGQAITTTFYRNMIGAHPSLKNIFSLRNQQTGAQQSALANSVVAYATYIDDLPKLHHAVERIAHKHASLFIKPEQYDIVGEHLMGAIGEVLGSALTEEVREAWAKAYTQLADVFIQREKQLYAESGDWTSWRKFRIAKKEAENEAVINFYLEPLDGKPLPEFLPGQYVTLQVPVPELNGLLQSRQFSLSEAPEKGTNHYRVSVKREETIDNAPIGDVAAGKVPGLISNMLHRRYNVGDEVELSAPQGEFFIDPAEKSTKPVVLISAGVGAAPLLSILDALIPSSKCPVSAPSTRPITWIHAAHHAGTACYGNHVRDVAEKHDNVTAKIFLDEVREGEDVAGTTYDFKGKLSLEKLAEENLIKLDDNEAEYYICGPEDWMVGVRAWLEERGVGRERQHLELFKTGDV